MKVLALCAAPEISPSTRYRLSQYVGPLGRLGIQLDIRPFLNSAEYARFYERTNIASRLRTVAGPLLRRFSDALSARDADVILVQREALFFGPAFFEWLARFAAGKPVLLDLDDAVHIPYRSERYGSIGAALKFFGKTDSLIRSSRMVICGGEPLAKYVSALGGDSFVIPTVVDPQVFTPTEKENDPPVVGWIGTPSTAPFLEAILPAVRRAAERHNFSLLVRGASAGTLSLDGLDVDIKPWTLESEVDDFRSIDIGLYPLVETESVSRAYLEGKSGFKAIQYLTLGIPYIVSPVGVAGAIGESGITHLEARSEAEWEEALETLLSDPSLRRRMGDAGRLHALANYDLNIWAKRLAEAIQHAAS